MPSFDQLLRHDGVVVAIISAIGAILAGVVARFFGFWTWLGGHFDRWLEDRRKMNPRVPRQTLHVIANRGQIPPMWQPHEVPDTDGVVACDCRAMILITNKSHVPITPVRAEVKLGVVDRFVRHRKVHNLRLMGPPRVSEVNPGQTAKGWVVSFDILPEMERSTRLVVDIAIYDQFDNAHMMRRVPFTFGWPDQFPTFV